MSQRPAGKDSGTATSARCPYWSAKLLSPSVRPAASASQPIRFCGRREARTKPITGMAMFTTSPKTSETSQLVMLAGTRCRSTYARIKPPTISASDPAAAHPATRRAVRALIWIP